MQLLCDLLTVAVIFPSSVGDIWPALHVHRHIMMYFISLWVTKFTVVLCYKLLSTLLQEFSAKSHKIAEKVIPPPTYLVIFACSHITMYFFLSGSPVRRVLQAVVYFLLQEFGPKSL